MFPMRPTTVRVSTRRLASAGLIILGMALTLVTNIAKAQMDFSGEWPVVRAQDNTDNPHLGEYVVHVAAEHDVHTIGQVQHPSHAEDHGESHRNEGIKTADNKTLDNDSHHGAATSQLPFNPGSRAPVV